MVSVILEGRLFPDCIEVGEDLAEAIVGVAALEHAIEELLCDIETVGRVSERVRAPIPVVLAGKSELV